MTDPPAAPAPRPPLAGVVLLVGIALLIAFALVGGPTGTSTADPSVIQLSSAEYRIAQSGSVDPSNRPAANGETGGLRVTLPHNIDRSIAGRLDSWYRITLPATSEPGARFALCVTHWSMNGDVFFDTARIGSGGSMDEPIARALWRPAFFELPGSAATPGAHRLDIHLASLPSQDPGLGRLLYGSRDGTKARCDAIDSSRRLISETLAFGMFMVGVFGSLQAWRFRDTAAYWFAVSAFAAAFKPAYMLFVDPPLSDWSWSLLYYAGRLTYVPAMVMFCVRFMGIGDRRIDFAVLGTHLVALAVLCLLPWSAWWQWLLVTSLIYTAVGVFAMAALARHAWRSLRSAAWGLLLAIAYSTIEALIDLGNWLMHAQAVTGVRSFLAIPVLMAAVAMLILERQAAAHARQLRLADQMREELARQRTELERVHERLAQERERFASTESRRRVLREMHDGVGSHLISASTLLASPTLERERVAELIDRAVMELRTTIDTLAPEQKFPATLLGAFRYRVEPILQARGMAIRWNVGDLPDDFCWDDRARLHLTRILQELIANALKHSACSEFSLRAGLAANGWLVVETHDDGRGFMPGDAGFGTGLRGMQDRIAEIGGSIDVRTAPGDGVHTTVNIPPQASGEV